eukprot:GGOE01006906.1.p5 GENE.GGOE01006906.1~~GGOE01006906.1.p5  ORF type:complete len:119 (-),score=4.78 GGOE01006906.1:78-434(-)
MHLIPSNLPPPFFEPHFGNPHDPDISSSPLSEEAECSCEGSHSILTTSLSDPALVHSSLARFVCCRICLSRDCGSPLEEGVFPKSSLLCFALVSCFLLPVVARCPPPESMERKSTGEL